MPTFGDYETVGEPISVANERGHVTTIWKAHRSGTAEGAAYAVKVYAPHRKSAEGGSEDALDRDRGLEFLEGIKQIKKAATAGGRCLAPVHALGTSAEGAWYVTDFFQRGSLAAWINRRVNVDSAALRQIVRCLVTGCLDLKRLRGESHGNLRTSNVFLVGKTRSLRKTPLVLADAYPAAPLKLSSLEGEDRRTAKELLHQVMEVQDLRAIGEIMLQLVEGRLVSSAYDYNYPVPRSAAWDNLGRDAERWRELCNQLLDPQLSLQHISLELLAKRFPAGGAAGKLPLILAAVGLACLLGVGGVCLVLAIQKHRTQARKDRGLRYAATMTEATNAWNQAKLEYGNTNYDSALAQITNAMQRCAEAQKLGNIARVDELLEALGNLRKLVADSKAEQSRQREILQRLQRFAAAIQEVTTALQQAQKKFDRAGSDPANYASALADLNEASNHLALATRFGESAQREQVAGLQRAMEQLRASVSSASEAYQQRATKEQKYATAMAAATNAWKQAQADLGAGQYDSARTQILNAMRQCDEARANGDAARVNQFKGVLNRLQADVQSAKEQQAARENQYARALSAATNALEQARMDYKQGSYDLALAQIAAGMKACGDAQGNGDAARINQFRELLGGLQTEVQAAKAGRLAMDRKYSDAMKAATNALEQARMDYKQGSYDLALAQIAAGMKACGDAQGNGDAARINQFRELLGGLQTEVQAAKAGRLAMDRKYSDAMKAATNALEQARMDYKQGSYDLALAQIAAGMKACGGAQGNGDAARINQFRELLGGLQIEVQAAKAGRLAMDRKYSDAMKAATNAWQQAQADYGKVDYDSALAQITKAMQQCEMARTNGAVGPVEGLEGELEKLQTSVRTTQQQEAAKLKLEQDKQTARQFFNNGEYEPVATLCAAHPGVAFFKSLAETNRFEQGKLADATNRFNNGDYSFVDALTALSFSAKPPFRNLLSEAADEQKILRDLTALQAIKKWPEVLAKLNDPAAARFKTKPPFRDLGNWAALLEAQQRESIDKLDEKFQIFLVEYGAVKAKDPYIRFESARKAKQITVYSKQDDDDVQKLEKDFGALLDQGDRKKYMKKLKGVLVNLLNNS